MSAAVGRIHVSVLPETGHVLVYDLKLHSVVHDLVDYGLDMVRVRQNAPTTVQETLWRLSRFWSYLCKNGHRPMDIDDAVVAQYAQIELALVKEDRSHRGSERASRQTVNLKISCVLRWLVWMQQMGRLPSQTIGPYACAVTAQSNDRRRLVDPTPRLSGAITSPLLLRNAGQGGSNPYATPEEFVRLQKTILESSANQYITSRNVLFTDIAKHAGLRRGSICSLTIDQFPAGLLGTYERDLFPVKPRVQKRSRENTFELPLDLALRVLDFIEGPRLELVSRLKASSRTTKDRIFLSNRSAAPISDRAITQSLRPSMRAVGTTKGKVVHVCRV